MVKVSLVGAGNIGGTLALLLASLNVGEIILFDVVEGLPQGKALDISHAASLLNFNTKIIGTNDLNDIKDSSICVVTAGVARKPGMSRDDLLKVNSEIISSLAENIKSKCPGAIVIVVTNPLDAMAWLFFKKSGFNKSKVVGMAGVLDSARYAFHISEKAGLNPSQISAMVLGGHGDDMVTVRSLTRLAGFPAGYFLGENELSEIENRVKNSGAEVVSLLKTGSAFISPAASCFTMIKAIISDEKKVLPSSCYLEGEYNLNDIYIGVPCILGRNGVEKVLEVSLDEKETEQMMASAARVRGLLEQLKSWYSL